MKRLFPKCFKSNLHAVSFHDLVSEKYPELKSTDMFTQLCKQYTSLLCGIHFLNNGGDLEKVRRRFQRFILMHYYPECEWDLVFQTYQRTIRHHSSLLWQQMIPEDRLLCQTHQQQLEEGIFQYFESVLRTKTKK